MMPKKKTASAQPWLAALVCVLGLIATACSALDLSTYGLPRYLNSDFLTPHFFCLNILHGGFPLSGWTLSASPYFVPDHVLLCTLLTAFNSSGQAYALYTFFFFPLLFGCMGLCLRTATGRAAPAFLATFLFANVMLACRALPGHALYLWWLGAPCCHGGVLLMGFVYLWVLGTGLRRDRVGWLPVPLFGVAWLGLCSDTLFLFQVLLPSVVALYICRRRHPVFASWVRWQNGCAGAALAGSQLFKLLCLKSSWFYFSSMIRVTPTPANQWRALGKFCSDLPLITRDGWAFVFFAVLMAAWLLRWLWKWRWAAPAVLAEGSNGGVLDFYRIFCAASLTIMLPLPIVTCAWRTANHVRYLFNWLVLPGFGLTLAWAEAAAMRAAVQSRRGVGRWALAGAAAVFLVCLGFAATGLRGQPLQFPYPDDAAALDALLARHGLKYGLAHYWKAKRLTALSHVGAELRQIRPNGELYFWDNNAFGYYAQAANGKLQWPAYQYIVVNTLHKNELRKVFGEPRAREHTGRYVVWLYAEDGQRRIREALEPAVRQKLGPARLSRLSQPLAPAPPLAAQTAGNVQPAEPEEERGSSR